MKRFAAFVAAIIVGCSACNSSSAGSSTVPLNKPFPSTTPALPATTALPTVPATTVTLAPITTAPPPVTTPVTTPATTPPPVPTEPPAPPIAQSPTVVSLADEITSPEQQAIVDTAIRTSPVLWVGWSNPNNPDLDTELQTAFIDDALEQWRGLFANMRQDNLFTRPDPDQPYALMPIPSSVNIDGDTATIRTCTVSSGLTYRRQPDGTEQLVNADVNLRWSTLRMKNVDGTWFVSRWSDEPSTRPGNTCHANP